MRICGDIFAVQELEPELGGSACGQQRYDDPPNLLWSWAQL